MSSDNLNPNDRTGSQSKELEQVENKSWLKKAIEHENFSRFAKFGFLDGSILLLGLFAGVSFDTIITRFTGVSGYGPLVGAAVGNTIADCVASIPEGKSAVLGITAGSILAAAPLFLSIVFKARLESKLTKRILTISYSTLIFGTLANRRFQEMYKSFESKKK